MRKAALPFHIYILRALFLESLDSRSGLCSLCLHLDYAMVQITLLQNKVSSQVVFHCNRIPFDIVHTGKRNPSHGHCPPRYCLPKKVPA